MQQKNTQKISYRDVFTQKEYLKVIAANLISRFGDSLDAIAFTWLVYAITGSASWSAIIFAMNQLPSILVQPFVGPLVESLNKKKILVLTDIIRGIIIVALAVLFMNNQITPWILVIFTLCISTVEAFHIPASMAAIPKIIEPQYYTYATSLNSTLSTVVQLIGIAAAGFIISGIGIGNAIIIDGITFFGSALILATLRLKEENLLKQKLNMNEYFATLKAGASYVKNQPVIRNFCILGMITNAVIVPINALQSPLIQDVMGQGTELLSGFSLALLIGMGFGSFFFPFIAEKMKPRTIIVTGGLIVALTFFAFTFGIYIQNNIIAIYALTCVTSFLLGAGASLLSSVLGVQFMKVVEQDYLARVGSIFNAGSSLATPVVSLIIGAVTVSFSVTEIFQISGALCVILFLFIGIRKVRFE